MASPSLDLQSVLKGREDFHMASAIHIQGADDKLGQFWVKIYRQRIVIEMFWSAHWKAVHLYYCITKCKQTVFIFKNMSTEYATCAAVLKALRTRIKPVLTNHIIFFCDGKHFNQDQNTNSQYVRWLCSDPKDVSIVATTHSGWMPNLMDHRSKGMCASQLNRLQPFRLFHVVRSWERGK